MGILIQPPPNQSSIPYVRWSHSVVGVFFDTSPPTSSFVFNIVNNHWETREPIRVLRTGPYFIFECTNLLDREALLQVHITIIDGKPITFRATSDNQIPSSLRFNMASIWIRVQDLPWRFLEADWTLRLLSHIGHVEAIDNYGAGLPLDPFLRARVLVDLSRPLIPGCFVPLDEGRVSWVYFRYEGIYRFCKECGCVGHNTGRCNLSAYDAHRITQRRIREFEEQGMAVLRAAEGIHLYTNMIRGLNDRFLNRNHKLNLFHARPSRFVPLHDPFVYPWYYANPPADMDSSSSDEFYDSSPDLPPPEVPGPRRGDPYAPYYPQHASGHQGAEVTPMGFGGIGPRFARSPSTRFSPDLPAQAQVTSVPAAQPLLEPHLNRSIQPPGSSPVAPPMGPLGFERFKPQSPPSQIFGTVGFGNWVQLSAQALRRLCGSPKTVNTELELGPSSSSGLLQQSGSLEDVVKQGWYIRAPPAPDEPGPSNWQSIPEAVPEYGDAVHEYDSSVGQDQSLHLKPADPDEPRELQHISSLINDRFRLSPPMDTDPLRPPVAAPQEELYSPSSPLDVTQVVTSDSTTTSGPMAAHDDLRHTAPDSPRQTPYFSGKKRRDYPLGRSHSADSCMLPESDNFQARSKRRSRRLEAWEAKGAFIIWLKSQSGVFTSKSLTDVSLARSLGVEPGEYVSSQLRGKRSATVSPEIGPRDWLGKKAKQDHSASNDPPTTPTTTCPMPSTPNDPSRMEDAADPSQPSVDP